MFGGLRKRKPKNAANKENEYIPNPARSYQSRTYLLGAGDYSYSVSSPQLEKKEISCFPHQSENFKSSVVANRVLPLVRTTRDPKKLATLPLGLWFSRCYCRRLFKLRKRRTRKRRVNVRLSLDTLDHLALKNLETLRRIGILTNIVMLSSTEKSFLHPNFRSTLKLVLVAVITACMFFSLGNALASYYHAVGLLDIIVFIYAYVLMLRTYVFEPPIT